MKNYPFVVKHEGLFVVLYLSTVSALIIGVYALIGA